MKKILDYTINKLNECKSIYTSYEQKLSQIDEYISKLLAIKENPDSIDESFLNEIISESYRCSKQYQEAISFKGCFSLYKDESQIKEALTYLDKIISERIALFTDEKEQIDSIVQENNSSIAIHTSIKEFIEKYDSSKHISEEELSTLDSLLNVENLSSELLDFYLEIAKNNVEIEKRHSKITIQDLELIDEDEAISDDEMLQIENDRQSQNRLDNKEENELLSKKKQYLSKLKAFKENQSYIEMNPNIYEYSKRILEEFETILTHDNLEILELALLAEEDISVLEVCDKKSIFMLAAGIAILNAYQTGDSKKVDDVIKEYMSNTMFVTNSEYLKYKGLGYYSELYELLEADYNESKTKPEIIDNALRSFEGMDYQKNIDIINANLETLNISEKDKREILLIIIYEDIFAMLINRNLKEEDTSILKNKLKLVREIYNEKEEKVIEEISEQIDPYKDEFENYIVFCYPDKFMKSFDEVLKIHGNIANPAHYIKKFDRLIHYNMEMLHNETYSHNIHEKYGRPNKFEILDLEGGSIRIGFKVIKNSMVNNHRVIMVFLSCFGLAEKSKELMKNVSIYRNNLQEMKDFEKIFSKENNKDKISQQAIDKIEEGKNIYRRIVEKAKNYKSVSNENEVASQSVAIIDLDSAIANENPNVGGRR